MGPKGKYNQAILDMVSRPLNITPSTSTSINPRVQFVLDRLVIAQTVVNNLAWTIESCIQFKGVGCHFFGKLNEQTQKGEIRFSIKKDIFFNGKLNFSFLVSRFYH